MRKERKWMKVFMRIWWVGLLILTVIVFYQLYGEKKIREFRNANQPSISVSCLASID